MKKIFGWVDLSKIKMLIYYVQRFAEKISDRYTAACAAQAAFFILLSIVPMASLIFALATYLPFSQQDVLDIVMRVIADEFAVYVIDIVNDLYDRAGSVVISLSIVATLWSASKGIQALIDGFNSMYDVREETGFLKSRLFAIVYTILFIIFFALILSVYVTISHYYRYYIRDAVEMGSILQELLWFVRYILGWLLLYAFILILYVVLPGGFGLPIGKEEHVNLSKRFKEQMPGAAFCAISWLIISRMVIFYIQNFPNVSLMYGSLAGIVVVMLWLYFCMYSLFVGAVINYLLSKGYLTHVKKMLK